MMPEVGVEILRGNNTRIWFGGSVWAYEIYRHENGEIPLNFARYLRRDRSIEVSPILKDSIAAFLRSEFNSRCLSQATLCLARPKFHVCPPQLYENSTHYFCGTGSLFMNDLF